LSPAALAPVAMLAYVGVRVRDLDRSIRFYEDGLGLVAGPRGTMRHGGVFVELEDPRSGQKLELNWYPPGSPYATEYVPGAELDHLGVEVDDADASIERLVALGAEVAIPAWTEAGPTSRYRIGFVRDPDGIWIEVESRLAP